MTDRQKDGAFSFVMLALGVLFVFLAFQHDSNPWAIKVLSMVQDALPAVSLFLGVFLLVLFVMGFLDTLSHGITKKEIGGPEID